jgi:hypothetical protein
LGHNSHIFIYDNCNTNPNSDGWLGTRCGDRTSANDTVEDVIYRQKAMSMHSISKSLPTKVIRRGRSVRPRVFLISVCCYVSSGKQLKTSTALLQW